MLEVSVKVVLLMLCRLGRAPLMLLRNLSAVVLMRGGLGELVDSLSWVGLLPPAPLHPDAREW